MKIKGVTSSEMEIIYSILSPYIDRYEFFFYGSRVKGDFRNLSDLDILVKSKDKINFDEIEKIKYQFDESDLSYLVNFTDYESVSKDFYDLIKKDLVKLSK